MIFGIGFLGGLTSTITTYFLEQKDRKNSFKDEVLSHIITKLQKFDDISQEEVQEICNVLSSLKK